MKKILILFPFFTLFILNTHPCIARTTILERIPVMGFEDQPVDLYMPETEGDQRAPLILFLHGAGGNSEEQALRTCPTENIESPNCFHKSATGLGFAVAFVNGTPNPDPRRRTLRTWNAGGGAGGWTCSSGYACENEVDSLAYLGQVVDQLAQSHAIDANRIFVVGFSNGGAMAHRIACEAADRIAGIASVSGENQFITSARCYPARRLPILDIHGTADPFWRYSGGPPVGSPDSGAYNSVVNTLRFWSSLNACPLRASLPLPDLANDFTRVIRHNFICSAGAPLVHYEVQNGGHTWPGGSGTAPRAGRTTYDISANDEILAFFLAN